MAAFKSDKRSCIEKLVTLIKGVNDGNTPVHKHYFNEVYVGMTEKIPTGYKNIAIIEPVTDPEFYYTTCATNFTYDFDLYITVLTKGHKDLAALDNLDALDSTILALRADEKLTGSCIYSTIEEVIYGDFGVEKRNLIAASRITLRINL